MQRRVLLGSALAAIAGACASGTRSGSRPANAQSTSPPAPASPPRATDHTERRILAVIEEVGKNQRAGNMLVPEADGRLLRVLTAAMGARHVVEIGTSVGYSGLWFSLALRATGGRLTTFEIDPDRLARARSNFERAGVADRVTIVPGDAHDEVKQLGGPIDLLFLDADKHGYLDYLQKLRGKLRPNGLIAAHNMVYPAPDPRFVQAITQDPTFETLFLNMDGAGMAVTLNKA
jgi:caffeoyl-CoA O-methyltransferase